MISVNITYGIFIVDHACKIMHKANKTGALLTKLAFLELRPHVGPVCPPPLKKNNCMEIPDPYPGPYDP